MRTKLSHIRQALPGSQHQETCLRTGRETAKALDHFLGEAQDGRGPFAPPGQVLSDRGSRDGWRHLFGAVSLEALIFCKCPAPRRTRPASIVRCAFSVSGSGRAGMTLTQYRSGREGRCECPQAGLGWDWGKGPALRLTSLFSPPDLSFLTCHMRLLARGDSSSSVRTLLSGNSFCVTIPAWTWVSWAMVGHDAQTLIWKSLPRP